MMRGKLGEIGDRARPARDQIVGLAYGLAEIFGGGQIGVRLSRVDDEGVKPRDAESGDLLSRHLPCCLIRNELSMTVEMEIAEECGEPGQYAHADFDAEHGDIVRRSAFARDGMTQIVATIDNSWQGLPPMWGNGMDIRRVGHIQG